MPRRRLAPTSWLRLPRRTARLRLTLFYGALFLLAGAILLTITYVLFEHATGSVTLPNGARILTNGTPPAAVGHSGGHVTLPPAGRSHQLSAIQSAVAQAHSGDLHQLVVQSAISFAIMAAVAVALGWLMAGRALRPVRTITATARDISATNLHQRLHLQGPDDEFTELGSTLDDLFARLEASIESQRRFVGNAAHELRSPLTEERTLLQVALADPAATVESLRATCETLLASNVEQARLLDALLTLATSERGIDQREAFDLAAVTGRALVVLQGEAERWRVQLNEALGSAVVLGDPALAERLAANLIDNALRYNRPGGRVEVMTGVEAGRAVLMVTNTGPVIAAAEVNRLLEPFQRLGSDRTSHQDGFGLGLSIVQAIAAAHDATIHVHPLPSGGLAVKAAFPLLQMPRQGQGSLSQFWVSATTTSMPK